MKLDPNSSFKLCSYVYGTSELADKPDYLSEYDLGFGHSHGYCNQNRTLVFLFNGSTEDLPLLRMEA